jgi:hypothetical protein
VDALTYGRGGCVARKNDLAEMPTNLDEYFFKLPAPMLPENPV